MRWTHRDELGEFLNDAALTERGVEVGSGAGEFATTVLRHWQGRQLTLIDFWAPQGHDAYLDCCNVTRTEHAANRTAAACLAAKDHRVRLLEGLSPDAAGQFENATLDYVYIDGNHAYLAVREDLRAWNPKVRPGGLLAGHDYLDGVRNGCLFGVKTAVDEFAEGLGIAVSFTTADAPWVSWYFRKPLGPPPLPSRITLLTAYDASLRKVGEISRANKEAYCGRHGYRFVCRTDGFDATRPAPWSKIRFVLDALADSDWVFWTDADSLVMNTRIPLTRFVQDMVDIVFSSDPYHGMNTGCFFVRNTAWARTFLERVYVQTAFIHDRLWENAAILDLYQRDPDVRRHAAVVPNKLFNGFPYEGGNYASGDFLVHLPGLAEREAALRNYAAMARD
jgi:hypothetical protein